MNYSIRQLARLAGISTRTLRYYDEIDLLKPAYVTDAGYRYYGEAEVTLLQQNLFYRERNFDLKTIQRIIYEDQFDIIQALEEHLSELERQKARTDALIQTLKQTISSMKGECNMTNQEKFEAFKKQTIQNNEEKYGNEIRDKYGDDEVDASNQKLLNMTENEWNDFQSLEAEICSRLKEGVLSGMKPEDDAAKIIVLLHKKWLCKTWKQYTCEAHKGVASLYTADERFTAYYDKDTAGCAQLLQQAICYWADKI